MNILKKEIIRHYHYTYEALHQEKKMPPVSPQLALRIEFRLR